MTFSLFMFSDFNVVRTYSTAKSDRIPRLDVHVTPTTNLVQRAIVAKVK